MLVSNYQILSTGKHINKLQFLFLVKVLCFFSYRVIKTRSLVECFVR